MQHGEGPITIRPSLLMRVETEESEEPKRRREVLDPTAFNL